MLLNPRYAPVVNNEFGMAEPLVAPLLVILAEFGTYRRATSEVAVP